MVLTVDDQKEYETMRKIGSETLLSEIQSNVTIFRTSVGEPSSEYFQKEREFGRADWKFVTDRFDKEAFWLLGSEGLDFWQQLDVRPRADFTSLSTCGLVRFRDAWTADTDVAFFRCGLFGLGGEGHCAHAHCDLLSFVLWARDQPLLVDSGIYTYHGLWRDHFRPTAAHNTVMDQWSRTSYSYTYFNWQQIPEAKCIDWTGGV